MPVVLFMICVATVANTKCPVSRQPVFKPRHAREFDVHVVRAIGKRKPAVSNMYLLKRMTEELKKIHTLSSRQQKILGSV